MSVHEVVRFAAPSLCLSKWQIKAGQTVDCTPCVTPMAQAYAYCILFCISPCRPGAQHHHLQHGDQGVLCFEPTAAGFQALRGSAEKGTYEGIFVGTYLDSMYVRMHLI